VLIRRRESDDVPYAARHAGENADLDTRNGFNPSTTGSAVRPDGTVDQPRRMPLPKR
jgi:hypothetical protein